MGTPDSTKSLSDILGARASNAGDAFHELWALRAALQLLVPGTELKALTVEGIAAPEASGSRWDSVDCGLFFGGDKLSTARKVELVQLKYSTADPDKAWTVARLTANSAKKGNNSILRKLAETYASAQQQILSNAGLAVRFISNQPLADAVHTTIATICRSESDTDATRLIRDATGMDGGALKGFLEALDFSAMGSASRQVVREELTSAVSEILESDAGAEVRELLQHIRELMLPGAEREKITLASLLSWFGLSGLSGLFPVPADLRLVADPIPRIPATNLLDAVIGGARLICVHGPAGCGKTTTMMQLPRLLPEGSVSVVFDCYGAGRYTHSNDRRHLPENAFLQIANELALNQGTPFLLARSGRNPVSIRGFLERIERSATILRRAKPNAVLAVLIDAADNSVAAAERVKPHDPCFVWELLGADLTRLPANVRIVISSRTARKPGLRLPAGTREIICPAFTKGETAAYVHAMHAHAPDAWIEQFHALSNGVVRVQNYALRKGGASLDAALNALRPRGKELDTVLRELFAEASAKAGNADFYHRCLAVLAVLPAPIPVEHLAALCATSAEAVIDFVHDVQPALRLELDTVTVSDEDVEDFIQQEAGPRLTAIRDDICNYFADRFRTDTYAAIHYADMLAKAARAAEILAVVEADLLPVAIADPIVRREVQLRRLRLALAACRSAGNGPDILKVVLLSAEASNDEATLRNLLEKETDLSVRFARPSLVRLVLSDRDTYPEQGSVLLQDAARAAQANDSVTARERLHAYDHWLRRRKDAKAEPRHRWTIEIDDLVARSEAIALVAGPQACRDDLFRWRPVQLRLQVGLKLIPILIARGRGELVRKAYEDRLVAKPWSLVLLVPLVLAGISVPKDYLEQELSALCRASVPDLREHVGGDNWQLPYLETIVTACEIGFTVGVQKSVLENALKLLLEHRRSPSRRFNQTDVQSIDIALRAWLLLRHLTNQNRDSTAANAFLREDNAPPPPKQRGRQKKNAPHKDGSETDDELSRTVQTILPIYGSRVEFLADAASNGGIARADPKAVLKGPGNDSYYLDHDYWGADFRRRIAQSVVRLMHLQGVAVEQLYQHAELITKGRYADAFANRSYAVWQELLLRKSMHGTLCDAVAKHAQEARHVRTGAKEKTNAFIKFSRLLLNFSEDDARALFERAIEIAQEVDREALNQIEFIATLSKNLGDEPAESWRSHAVAHARFVTDVAIRLEGEEHFPWQEAVVGILNLAPDVALAAIGQWQDEGIAGLQETLPTWLRELVDHHEQPVELACAFQILLQKSPPELVSHFAQIAAARRPISIEALDMLASDCLLHAPPHMRERHAEMILKALPKDYGGGEPIRTLRAVAAQASSKSTDGGEGAQTAKPDRLAIPPEFNFTTEKGLKDALTWARKQENYVPLDAVFAQMLDSVTSPSDRVPYLNALSEFDEDSLDANARATALLNALALWTGQPAVDRWREQNLPKIIGDNLWPLSRWLGERSNKLVELLDAAGLAGAVRIDVIAKGLEAGAQQYSSKTLFVIAEIIAGSLSTAAAGDVLAWYTVRLHSTVPADIQARFDAEDIPVSLNAAIGRFLCGQLSDIDTRVRWRAAHCIRRLSSCLGAEPLVALFACYDQLVERSFRLRDAPYYWLAARLWSVIVAARVAEENPQAAAMLAPKLVEIALDDGFPHFLVRQYAKAALDSLKRTGAVVLTANVTDRIRAVNLPKLAPVKAPKSYSRGLDRDERKEPHFKFNSLDTIPYWYSPLQRLFAKLDADAFFAGLETWLLGKWKVDPEANWWDKEPRRARYNDRDYGTWSHGHGSQPIVERYGTYLEWHVMFCALGEWLETEPLAIPEYESDSDSLEYWAKGWSLSEPPTWVSDRRGFTPLEPELKCGVEGEAKHWLRRIPRASFLDAVLGADRHTRDDLTVDGSWTAAQLTREERVSIRSALVSPKPARALVRTMQDAKPYTTSLPYGHERDDGIEVPPYRLKSWLERRPQEVRFDSSDPLRHDVSGLSVQPGDAITDAFGLQPGPAPVSCWHAKPEKVGLAYQTWADFGDAERERHQTQRRVGTHGERLKVERGLLRKFLVHQDLDLIMKIRIERRLENEYGRSKSWDNKGKENTVERILLFRQDGTIEDRDGRIGTWSATRQRA